MISKMLRQCEDAAVLLERREAAVIQKENDFDATRTRRIAIETFRRRNLEAGITARLASTGEYHLEG